MKIHSLGEEIKQEWEYKKKIGVGKNQTYSISL